MNEVTRRDALRLGAAGAVVAGTPLAIVAKEDKKEESQGSGPPSVQRRIKELSIDLSKVKVEKMAERMGCFFTRMSPDPSPGRNVLTISGLPDGTRGISAWATEWSQGDKPHAGGAFFNTLSVQLYDNGTKCRVVFELDWGSHLPGGAQVIFC